MKPLLLPAADCLPPTASGFLNVRKSPGFTSHDVVAVMRRLTGIRRVGHAGTLDPAADGVLPICIGRATRLVDQLSDADKGYHAEIVLGIRTTTDDAEGEVMARAEAPELDARAIEVALAPFRGEIAQTPPSFSAVKVGGRRAYALARAGAEVQLRPRQVTVHRLALEWFRPPVVAVSIACSKGTYIRSIARDLGELLGCGAHLARLIRLWVGPFRLEQAHSVDELKSLGERGELSSVLLEPDFAVPHLPAVIVELTRREDMRHGRAWPMDVTSPPGITRVYDAAGAFLGLAEADPRHALWHPKLAFE